MGSQGGNSLQIAFRKCPYFPAKIDDLHLKSSWQKLSPEELRKKVIPQPVKRIVTFL
jgi:hypothetical protein